MRIRVAQPFPVSSNGQIDLPKRPESWRIVGAAVSWTCSALVAQRQMVLRIVDGGFNLLLDFVGPQTYAATSSVVTTFASGVSSVYGTPLNNEMIALPDDLWIQQNWQAQLRIGNSQVGDTLSANVIIEIYEELKKGARQPRNAVRQ